MMSATKSASKTGFFRFLGEKVGLLKVTGNGDADVELSSFARIAMEKGYLDDDQAAQLTELESEDNSADTSRDIVVQQDWMTESQAEIVALARDEQEPEEALDDRFKQAQRAVEKTHATMKRLEGSTRSNGAITTADIVLSEEVE